MPFPWLAAATVASTIGSALLSNEAADDASDAAEAAAAANRAAAEQARQEALRLQTPLLDFGYGAIPELTAHLGSGNILNGLTGGATPTPSAPAPTVASLLGPQPGSGDWAAYLSANPDVAAEYQQEANRDAKSRANLAAQGIKSAEDFARWHYENFGRAEGRQLATVAAPTPSAPTSPSPTSPGTPTSPAPAAPTSAAGAAQVYGPELISRPEIAPRPVVNRRPEIARPSILDAPAPTFSMPTRTRETLEAPTRAPVPTYTRREVTPFSFTAEDYRESPGYQFELEQGNRNILANLAVTGGLESGDALKGLTRYAQGLADQDWDDERDFAYGVWNDNTNRMDRLDSEDMGYLYDNYWKGWDADFGLYRYGQDRLDDAYEFDVTSDRANQRQAYDIYADQRNFAYNDYRASVNRNDTLDNFDISRSDANYDTDTDRTQNLYTIDRNYLTDRWDQKTTDLFRRLGIGQGAANSITGAGQNYVNTVTGANDSAASASGNASLIGASNTNDLLAQLVKLLGKG